MSEYPSWILSHSVSEPEPPTTTMADRYMNLMLNQLSFNWDSTNMIAEWKRFCGQVELLLDVEPYSSMEEKQKVTTLLNWMNDKGKKIYNEQLVFPTEEPNKKNKNVLKDVLDVFEAHFTSLQLMIDSWYNLEALHSHHCKDQANFISQLPALTKDCAFTQEDKVVKFLFLIHNSHKCIQDQLLKDVTKDSNITDCTKCKMSQGSYPEASP